MDRFLLAIAAALVSVSCAAAFKDQRTPSGDFCSDMPIIPAGQDTDREYHRLQPITSDPTARTEAERLESLRKVACKTGADAVIEAVNEEVRGENASYSTVSSGTAVIWVHRSVGTSNETKTLPTAAAKKPVPITLPEPPPSPAAPSATPTSEPSATPTAPAKPAKPGKPKAKSSASTKSEPR